MSGLCQVAAIRGPDGTLEIDSAAMSTVVAARFAAKWAARALQERATVMDFCAQWGGAPDVGIVEDELAAAAAAHELRWRGRPPAALQMGTASSPGLAMAMFAPRVRSAGRPRGRALQALCAARSRWRACVAPLAGD